MSQFDDLTQSNKNQLFANIQADEDLSRFNLLLSNMHGMFYQCLSDDFWTFTFVSKGCLSLTGYPPEDLLFNRRLSFRDIVYEADFTAQEAEIKSAVNAHQSFDLEYCIRHANGDLIWVSERGMPVFDEDGKLQLIQGFIQDITSQKSAEQSLQEAEKRYRSIFENSVEGIFQTSPDGHYLAVNPALASIYGYDSVDDLIEGLQDIKNQLYVDDERRQQFVDEMDAHGVVQKFESLIYRKDKSTIWISENARKVFDETGELQYYEGMVEDVTERKRYEDKIEHQATHDSLTGLPNRYLLNDRLQQNINLCDRNHSKLAVAFLDLDNFKVINDTMSHEVGDGLLKIVAERIASNVREIDTVARLGGDEFVILISNLRNIDDLDISLQRILNAVSKPCVINNLDFMVSCSMGVSIYPVHGGTSANLLKNADVALHQAKRLGRNNYQVFSQILNDALVERVQLEYSLRLAMVNMEFLLHYQPKVLFATGKIVGAEALIRWQPEGKKMVPPIQFIDTAEETGLIISMGEWVLREACVKACEWHAKFDTSFKMAVNVSLTQFRHENFLATVQSVLETTGIRPDMLELEITESLAAQDVQNFIEKLKSLKKLGVNLAMDDFGTGYSSLTYLKNFPIDCLKIDKAFVSKLESEPKNTAILKAIVVLGQSLGMKVVAEGVETDFQHECLYNLGCDEYQGYLFSKPVPEKAFEQLMQQQIRY